METKDKVKELVDIVDLVGGYVELKKSGRNYKGVCPFHSEKTPSFMVSPELQIYKCFGCNKSGDVFSFVEEIEGVDFSTALAQLADRVGVEVESAFTDPQKKKKELLYKINDNAAQFYQHLLLNHSVGIEAKEYLKKRGITPQAIKDFRIGFAPNNWSTAYDALSKRYSAQDLAAAGLTLPKKSGQGYVDRFRGRIMFPLVGLQGEVLGFSGRTVTGDEPKYLNTSETLIFNKSSFIYGLDKAKVEIKHSGAVFVEGQVDVVSAHQAGLNNVIATSGTSLTQTQLKILKRYTTDITFCFDTDTAGVNAIFRGVDLAEKEDFNITVSVLPEKYKDLDEFVQADPIKAKLHMQEAKLPIYDFFIMSTVKKYDKKTSIGKKKIMNDLTPLFNKIKSPVTLDHYIKRISGELDLSEDTVATLISGDQTDSLITNDSHVKDLPATTISLSKKSPHEYILALLLKADLDTTQTILYKLGQKDFTDTVLQQVFVSLKDYLLGRQRRFEIKYFIKRLDESLQPLVNEMYLWDMGNLTDNPTHLLKEIDTAYSRIKRETIRREMREMSVKIKEAEANKNPDLLVEYTNKLKELSGKLI